MREFRNWQPVTPRTDQTVNPSERYTKVLLGIVLGLLALLSWGQVYLYLQLKHIREIGDKIAERSWATQEALKKDMQDRMDALDQAYQKTTRGIHADVMMAAGSAATTHEELRKTKALTEKLQAEQQRSAGELTRALTGKANQQQVGALSQDLSATRKDLDTTQKNLRETLEKVGMTRSEFGTLIARNHDEIEQLRRLGERDYFEFGLIRAGAPQQVGGVGLQLRKTNEKKLQYTLILYADDYRVEKKDRTINEPVFFFVRGQRQPVELVVNKITSNRVLGYLSVPKGALAAGNLKADSSRGSDWEPFNEIKAKETSRASDNQRLATSESGGPVKQVKLGMTFQEVEAVLGPPPTRADLGEKVLYKYRDMTIEFQKGKVTDFR